MADVFDALIGQERAVAAMRQYVKNPVHAYLVSGPVGSSLHDALVALSAALQCPEHGCGTCEVCRLVLSGNDPDVYFAQRAGVSWRIDELREAERVSRRRPLGSGYEIVVIENVELTTTGSSPSAPALLKSLEEPGARTVFLLGAEDVPPALDTVVSRCVEVKLKGLLEADIEQILVREGAERDGAKVAALAASGNLRRARVLVRDAALAQRIAQWRAVPERLDGTPATASAVALEISRSLDEALAPLARMQEEEIELRRREASDLGQRSLTNRRELEAQFKREQRRFRIDELRFGLTALTNVYRERLVVNLEVGDRADARSQYRVGACVRAIDAIARSARSLAANVDESLLLHDLMFSLMEF